jgi:hypothetical protein
MSKDSIFGGSKIVAFVHITDWAAARVSPGSKIQTRTC